MRTKARLFVVSGPSGCGKTTLCRGLLKRCAGLARSKSVTTRLLRRGERKGVDYIYVTEEEFKRRLRNRDFIEYAKVFGSYYGTPKRPLLNRLKEGKSVVLSIDVEGASQIKKIFKDAVLIFILPPSFSDLRQRLRKRSSDTAAQIDKRLKIARREMRALKFYDYVVINDDITAVVRQLAAIVAAEQRKVIKDTRRDRVWQR